MYGTVWSVTAGMGHAAASFVLCIRHVKHAPHFAWHSAHKEENLFSKFDVKSKGDFEIKP